MAWGHENNHSSNNFTETYHDGPWSSFQACQWKPTRVTTNKEVSKTSSRNRLFIWRKKVGNPGSARRFDFDKNLHLFN